MAITLLGIFIVCIGMESSKSQSDFPILSVSRNVYEPITSYQNNFTYNGNNQNHPASGLSTPVHRTPTEDNRNETVTLSPLYNVTQTDEDNDDMIHNLSLQAQKIETDQAYDRTEQKVNAENEFILRNHTKGQSNKKENGLYGENKKSTHNQSFLDKLEASLNASHEDDERPNPGYRPVIGGERVVPSYWETPPPVAEVIAGGETVTFPSVSLTTGINYITGGEKVTPIPPIPVRPLQWHVGIYSKAFKPYMQICGGTLVTLNAVISAAHCFWSDLDKELPVERFAVGAGKLHRPWHDIYDFYAQTSDVLAVHLPPRYRGASTNFQDDIVVVLLATPFTTSRAVRPACVLFDDHLESIHLHEGNEGIVLGWGLTSENGPPAQSLHSLRMPYVPIEECIADAHPSFLKYITSDKICAGVTTGKVLCRGDSGGGLVFFDLSTSEPAPLLFGVASTAPRNEHLCNAHARASLTRVLAHRTFLRTHIPDIEDSCEKNYKAFRSSTNGLASRIGNLVDTEAPPQNTQPTFICNCYCNNSTTP